MPVYAIRAGETGPVKLGVSINPQARLVDLQIAHWESLRLIKLWEGGETEEARLHLRFADLHIRGEWFAFSRLMLADVGLTEIPIKKQTPPAPPLVMGATLSADQIIKALGGATKLARHSDLMIRRSATANWPTDGIPAKYWPTLARIAASRPETALITLPTLERHTFTSSKRQAAA